MSHDAERYIIFERDDAGPYYSAVLGELLDVDRAMEADKGSLERYRRLDAAQTAALSAKDAAHAAEIERLRIMTMQIVTANCDSSRNALEIIEYIKALFSTPALPPAGTGGSAE